MVLLTVDTIVFLTLCPVSPQPHILISYLSSYLYGGGRLCTYAVQHVHFTFLQLSTVRANTLAIQLLMLWATIMAFHVTHQVVFLVRNHSCKTEFQFITLLHDVAPKFCTLYSCILFQIKWKKIVYLWLLLIDPDWTLWMSHQKNRFRRWKIL